MNAMDSLVRYGYLVIFGAVFAEQVGLPFPSEPSARARAKKPAPTPPYS